MVATKSLVASTLLALLLAPIALADNPALRIDANDQAWATRALLRPTDFGIGWRGGLRRTGKPTGVACPSFNPKASDLTVTGYGSASFYSPRARVSIDIDTQVMNSVDAVETDFARTVQPPLAECLKHLVGRAPDVVSVAVERLEFPRLGTISAAFRATIVRGSRGPGPAAKWLRDFVFFAQGRMEYSLVVEADARYRPQLVAFEADMARILLKRAVRGE